MTDVFNKIFNLLYEIDTFFWSYIGFVIVILAGFYFSIKSKWFQFRTLYNFKRNIGEVINYEVKNEVKKGTSPIKLYFASVGGMVGLGNIVIITTAVTWGGPGSLFWLWVSSFFGMLIKYSEIYLGVKYRVPNKEGGYDGGPMYYLKEAYKSKYIPIIVSILLCIYGVEVSQFLTITDNFVYTFGFERKLVIICLLAVVFYSAIGGINRLATICTILMPPFMILYVSMCLWVIFSNADMLPSIFSMILKSAFEGHAPVAGFAGSSFLMAAQYGTEKSVYSGDIGIGYDSIIQSETKTTKPEKQARLAIFALLTDSIICTMTILVILVTDIWKLGDSLRPDAYVSTALASYFPHMDIFMAILLFLAAFTTIIAYLSVGMKCSLFLLPENGKKIYTIYAIIAFTFFSFFDQNNVILIMGLSSGILLLLNLIGIIKLRKEIQFK